MSATWNGPRRAQADRRAESDRRMLRAAIQLIAKHGAKGASLAQIGVAAGYSRGLPAERFGTKLALLGAVMQATLDWFGRRLERVLGERRGLDALRVRTVTHLTAVRDSPEAAITLYQLMVDATGAVPELKPQVGELNGRYREGLRRHLEEARDAGELRPDEDIEALSRLLLAVMHGLSIQALSEDRAEDLPEEMARACDAVIRGIGAKS